MLGTPLWDFLTQITWSMKTHPKSGLQHLVTVHIKTWKRAALLLDCLPICLPCWWGLGLNSTSSGFQCRLKAVALQEPSQILAPAWELRDIQHHGLTEHPLDSWPLICWTPETLYCTPGWDIHPWYQFYRFCYFTVDLCFVWMMMSFALHRLFILWGSIS